METNVVFSKVKNEYVPVTIKKMVRDERASIRTSFCPIITEYETTEYDVYHGRQMVGYVTVDDTPNGCNIGYIKNEEPEKYGKFGLLADRLEVQHCLNNEMIDFEIRGYASMNSHA